MTYRLDSLIRVLRPEFPSYVSIGAVTSRLVFTVEGNLTVAVGKLHIPNKTGVSLIITKVALQCDTAPTGDAVIVDIHKDTAGVGSTTIFTNQAHRPQIAAGSLVGETILIDVPTWATGDSLSMDVDNIGSIIPGSDLAVVIVFHT